MLDSISSMPFGELLKKIIDNRGRTCPTVNSGIPLIATNCIKSENLYPVFERVRYVSKDVFENWFRGHPEPGDIIFVNKGTPGRVCLVPNPLNFCIAQDMVAIRADENKIYPKYLFAALRSENLQGEIANLHVGSLIPHFKKSDFNDLKIPIPDDETQKFIGDLYFSLSSKIDLLGRQNNTLEEIANALFTQRILKFKLENSTKELVDSGIGEIPVGWQLKELKDCLSLLIDNRGKTPKYLPAGVPALSAKYVKSGKIVNSHSFNYISLELYESSEKLKVGDIMMTSEAPLGELYFVAQNTYYYPAQRMFALRANPNVLSAEYLYCWLNSKVGQHLIKSRASGSTVEGIKQSELNRIEVLIPNKETLGIITNFLKPIFIKRESNFDQIQTLTHLRNTLLQKLMSGEAKAKH
jgi:type I restriction enzyme S subunit